MIFTLNESNMEFKNITEYRNYLINFLKDLNKKTNTEGYILGVSGGIDSAVLAGLLSLAKIKNICLFMPCNSPEIDYECVRNLEDYFGLNILNIDLEDTFNVLKKSLKGDFNDFSLNQIKPRLRMTTLYSYANANNMLVLGTSNKCEWYLGYFTKYGDGGSDVAPLIHLDKNKIYELAKILNIPQIIIKRPPSASLFDGQTDEEELGFTYNDINNFLSDKQIDSNSYSKINNIHKKTEHKRNNIIFPKPFNVSK